MNILLIGGTGFIGPHVARELAQQGHNVTVYHRGESPGCMPASVRRITGDRNNLLADSNKLRRESPEVVIDLILSGRRQAKALMEVFRGVARRIIALSSGDVYRAAGILHGLEPGGLQPLPLTETSELRSVSNVYPTEQIRRLQKVFSWLDDEYDKIPVEQTVMGDPQLIGTVLRLPMVYGPGDPLHRTFPYVKRMDDRRPAILIQEEAASWRAPRGYVENVAAAIARAAVSSRAEGRIYNIAEPEAFTEIEWVRKIAQSAGWCGEVVPVPRDVTPEHLRVSHNTEQHWVMSSARIREELDFQEPVEPAVALARTIAWERENPPPIDPAQFDYAAEDSAIAKYRDCTTTGARVPELDVRRD
ncbi:MAG: NAD-dependent epimerase/dehydratase family protein [Acidobacteriaceae bacterium]|nr:NAD-dependent epimerase/dehydratase family protein [Acidobacteriaceae bacterium]MBV9781899.1 NAD-dependent epimerase/dehydratase family protein [Acidobacteriaceae bacterium]